jgi:hypothetical protein
MVTQKRKTPFLLLSHHSKQILYKAQTPHHECALTISTILHEFQSFGGGLDHVLQMYALHYSLQFGVTQLFFHTFYLLLLFNIFIEVPIANSSINA